MVDLDKDRLLTPGELEMAALRAAQDAHLKPMFERMQRADAREAIGMVEEITGFGDGAELSMSIELKPWRWAHGPLEQGSLYIRKEGIDRQEQRDTRERLPRFSLARVSVRPDVARREDGSLWDCLLEGIVELSPADSELQLLADRLREKEPKQSLGRPAFDFRWLLFDLLGRLLPKPETAVVHLGQALPDGDWQSRADSMLFAGCDVLDLTTDAGTITVGVLDRRVEGVQYDLEIYRGSGSQRMRKLQTLLQLHGRSTGKLHRILDNQGGAMMYRTRGGEVLAIYAYNVDVFIVHSKRTSVAPACM